MRKSLPILGLMLVFAASSIAQETCKLLGTTLNIADGKVITLGVFDHKGTILDSTYVKDGKFEFVIPVNEETTYYPLSITYVETERRWGSQLVFVEPGATLRVTFSLDHANKVYGSPLNFIQTVYEMGRYEFSKEIRPLRFAARDKSLSESERAEKTRKADMIYGKLVEYEQQFAYDNLDNLVGLNIFTGMAPSFNKEFIQVLDLYVFNLMSSGGYPVSVAVSMLKSLVSLVLLIIVNGASKKIRGESIL